MLRVVRGALEISFSYLFIYGHKLECFRRTWGCRMYKITKSPSSKCSTKTPMADCREENSACCCLSTNSTISSMLERKRQFATFVLLSYKRLLTTLHLFTHFIIDRVYLSTCSNRYILADFLAVRIFLFLAVRIFLFNSDQ